MPVVRTAVLGALVVAVAACASARQTEPEVGAARSGSMPITVENESTANLRIFAAAGSNEILLGRVEGMQNRTLRLPQGFSGTMRLVARTGPGVGDGHVSEPFSLNLGQRLTWKLRESPGAAGGPRISSVHVFNCGETENC